MNRRVRGGLWAALVAVGLAACGALPTDTVGLSPSGATALPNVIVRVDVITPGGVQGDVSVRASSGLTWPVTGDSLVLRELPPGEYVIEAREVLALGFRYRPAVTSAVLALGPGALAESRVTYSAASGAMSVTLGTVSGASPEVTVTGYGYRRTLAGAGTYALDDLPPGPYRVAASTFRESGGVVEPVVVEQDLTVRAGERLAMTIDSLIRLAPGS